MFALSLTDGLYNLLEELDRLADARELARFMGRLVDTYGLATFAYLGSGIGAHIGAEPYLAVTYSDEWVEHYKAQKFIEIDPTVQTGMRRLLPVDWSELDRTGSRAKRLFGEAQEFGLGRHGISLPVHGRHGDRALVSVTSDVGDLDWRHLSRHYMRDLQLLALHLHHSIMRLEGRLRPVSAVLSPRERECLQWVAEGKTYWECAVILGLSEHTVRCYLESARHKLGAANTTHAVSKASKANLLSELS